MPTAPSSSRAEGERQRRLRNRTRGGGASQMISPPPEGCIYSDRLRDQRVSFEAGLGWPGTRGRAWNTSRPAGVSRYCTQPAKCRPMRIALREGHRKLRLRPQAHTHEASPPHIAPADAGTTVRARGGIGRSVRGVGSKDSLQMAAANHQNPVQAFGPDRADPAFGECVRSRSPDRGLDHVHAFGAEDLVERGRRTWRPGPGSRTGSFEAAPPPPGCGLAGSPTLSLGSGCFSSERAISTPARSPSRMPGRSPRSHRFDEASTLFRCSNSSSEISPRANRFSRIVLVSDLGPSPDSRREPPAKALTANTTTVVRPPQNTSIMSVPQNQSHPSIMALTSRDRSPAARMRRLTALSACAT